MKKVAGSKLLNLNHSKQNSKTLLKELTPSNLERVYKRSGEGGVEVNRAQNKEDDWTIVLVHKR